MVAALRNVIFANMVCPILRASATLIGQLAHPAISARRRVRGSRRRLPIGVAASGATLKCGTR
jgi:hypothetical protein